MRWFTTHIRISPHNSTFTCMRRNVVFLPHKDNWFNHLLKTLRNKVRNGIIVEHETNIVYAAILLCGATLRTILEYCLLKGEGVALRIVTNTEVTSLESCLWHQWRQRVFVHIIVILNLLLFYRCRLIKNCYHSFHIRLQTYAFFLI